MLSTPQEGVEGGSSASGPPTPLSTRRCDKGGRMHRVLADSPAALALAAQFDVADLTRLRERLVQVGWADGDAGVWGCRTTPPA